MHIGQVALNLAVRGAAIRRQTMPVDYLPQPPMKRVSPVKTSFSEEPSSLHK